MKTPKYLERFKKAAARERAGILEGSKMIVEILEQPNQASEDLRKTEGGIFLAEDADHARAQYGMLKSCVVVVLEVGAGYYDPDTGEDKPLGREVGNVLWINGMAPGRLSTIPELEVGIPDATIAIIDDNDVIKAWRDVEEFEKDRAALSG